MYSVLGIIWMLVVCPAFAQNDLPWHRKHYLKTDTVSSRSGSLHSLMTVLREHINKHVTSHPNQHHNIRIYANTLSDAVPHNRLPSTPVNQAQLDNKPAKPEQQTIFHHTLNRKYMDPSVNMSNNDAINENQLFADQPFKLIDKMRRSIDIFAPNIRLVMPEVKSSRAVTDRQEIPWINDKPVMEPSTMTDRHNSAVYNNSYKQHFDVKSPSDMVARPVTETPDTNTFKASGHLANSRQSSDQWTNSRQSSDQATNSGQPSDQATYSRQQSDQATNSRQPSDQATNSGQPSDQATNSGQPSDQATNSGQPSDQATNSRQPSDQATNSRQPSDQATNSHQPSDQATNSHQPSDQATNSRQPSDQATNSGQPSDQATNSRQPSDQATNSRQPSDQATNSGQPSDQATNSRQPSDQATNSHQPSDQATKSHQPSGQPTNFHQPSDQSINSRQPSEHSTISRQPSDQPIKFRQPSWKSANSHQRSSVQTANSRKSSDQPVHSRQTWDEIEGSGESGIVMFSTRLDSPETTVVKNRPVLSAVTHITHTNEEDLTDTQTHSTIFFTDAETGTAQTTAPMEANSTIATNTTINYSLIANKFAVTPVSLPATNWIVFSNQPLRQISEQKVQPATVISLPTLPPVVKYTKHPLKKVSPDRDLHQNGVQPIAATANIITGSSIEFDAIRQRVEQAKADRSANRAARIGNTYDSALTSLILIVGTSSTALLVLITIGLVVAFGGPRTKRSRVGTPTHQRQTQAPIIQHYPMVSQSYSEASSVSQCSSSDTHSVTDTLHHQHNTLSTVFGAVNVGFVSDHDYERALYASTNKEHDDEQTQSGATDSDGQNLEANSTKKQPSRYEIGF